MIGNHLPENDPDAFAKRELLAAMGFDMMTIEEERSWVARTRRRLRNAGETLPSCGLDPDGTKCCAENHSSCSATCKTAFNRHKCDIAIDAIKILENVSETFFFATLIDPSWAQPMGYLSNFDLYSARNFIAKRIQRTPYRFFGAGGFEIDFNHTPKIKKNWTPHLHFIAAGLPHDELYHTLRPSSDDLLYPKQKPLVIKEVDRADLEKVLAYSWKGYASDCGGRSYKHPLAPMHQLELDKFMLSQRTSDYMLFAGMKRYGRKLRMRPLSSLTVPF